MSEKRKELKEKLINFKLSEAEYSQLKQLAIKNSGGNISKLLRQWLAEVSGVNFVAGSASCRKPSPSLSEVKVSSTGLH